MGTRASSSYIRRQGWKNRRRRPSLHKVTELTNLRSSKNETDEMYIAGWNAAMNKIKKVIEEELG